MRFTRILVGLIGVFHGIWAIKEGYIDSRSGEWAVLPLFPWVPTAQWIEAVAVAVVIAGSVCVVFGFRIRLTAALVALALVYIVVSDWWAFHHSTFLAANIFALLAWAGTKPSPSYRGAWFALQVLLFAVYIFAGLHKLLGEGFRSGLVVEQTTTVLSRWIIEVFPAFVPLSTWGTIAVELLLPFGLLVPKLRIWVAVAGIGFHILVLACTGRGPVFNMYLPALYPLFIVTEATRLADWVEARVPSTRRVFSWLREPEGEAA